MAAAGSPCMGPLLLRYPSERTAQPYTRRSGVHSTVDGRRALSGRRRCRCSYSWPPQTEGGNDGAFIRPRYQLGRSVAKKSQRRSYPGPGDLSVLVVRSFALSPVLFPGQAAEGSGCRAAVMASRRCARSVAAVDDRQTNRIPSRCNGEMDPTGYIHKSGCNGVQWDATGVCALACLDAPMARSEGLTANTAKQRRRISTARWVGACNSVGLQVWPVDVR